MKGEIRLAPSNSDLRILLDQPVAYIVGFRKRL